MFNSARDAEGARQQLILTGIEESRITIVSPEHAGQGAGRHNTPDHETFLHDEALREGRSVLVAFVDDEIQAQSARDVLRLSGAETLESARERWWSNLRDAEEQHYRELGFDFHEDELTYRKGFQAALDRNIRGKPYYEALDYLRKHYPDVSQQSFRHGYERGLKHYQTLKEKYRK